MVSRFVDQTHLLIPITDLNNLIQHFTLPKGVQLKIESYFDVPKIHDKNSKQTITIDELYRICTGKPPENPDIDIFSIKMICFDVEFGVNLLYILPESTKKSQKWERFEAIKPKIEANRLCKEISVVNIPKFIEKCKHLNIKEQQLWQLIMDDTYKKSQMILDLYQPLIIPLKDTEFQKYNGHMIMFTNAGTGKTQSLKRFNTNLLPPEDYTIAGLIGTHTKEGSSPGKLTGEGVFMFDEVSKWEAKLTEKKFLDQVMTYMEEGEQSRALYIPVTCYGTKTLIFCGNISAIELSSTDFYHIMKKISQFGEDSDRIGRRLGMIVYENKLNIMDNIKPLYQQPLLHKSLQLINQFKKELFRCEHVNKTIRTIIFHLENWINSEDYEHNQKINHYIDTTMSKSIKSLIKGIKISSNKKLKFMALRKVITDHLFDIYDKISAVKFEEKYKDEIKEQYEQYKIYLCENLKNITTPNKKLKIGQFINYVNTNNINIHEEISSEIILEITSKLDITENTVRDYLWKMRKGIGIDEESESTGGIERT